MNVKDISMKVQKWTSAVLFIGGVILVVTTYKGWFVPSPLMAFNLGLLSLGLLTFQIIRKGGNRKKEAWLLFTTTLYINLFISSIIYKIWPYEKVFTKIGITQMTMFVLFILGIYLNIAYIRAKITYKRVKGNQRSNQSWHVTKSELKRMRESDDIYLNLGIYAEENHNR